MMHGFWSRILPCVFGAGIILGSYFFIKERGPEGSIYPDTSQRSSGRSAAGEASRTSRNLPFHFEEIGEKAGLHMVHQRSDVAPELQNVEPLLGARGASVSVADFNNDGLMDVYLTSAGEESLNALYRNNGDGTFTDVASELGVADINKGINSMSALWLDYDRDGWKDLYVVAMGCNRLFRNIQGKKFEDVTAEAGDIAGRPNMNGFCGSPRSALALDYNLDGHLDIFVSNFNPKDWRKIHNGDTAVMFVSPVFDPNGPQAYLFRNNGDGTFTEVAKELGIGNYHWAQSAGSSDLDNDGWPDIFVANDVGRDRVYINKQGQGFELKEDALPNLFPRYGMNGDIADVNNDGLPDIYNTKITRKGFTSGRNQLWMNQGDGRFIDAGVQMGVSACGWAWAGRFVDLASRGAKDLVVVNGLNSGTEKSYWFNIMSLSSMDSLLFKEAKFWPKIGKRDYSGNEKNCVFYREGRGQYTDVSAEVGMNDIWDGRGLSTIDVDNDGRPDFIIGNVGKRALYYRNVAKHDNAWIGFSLKGIKSNIDAVGARLKLTHRRSNGKIHTQYWEVNAGNGYASQADPRLLFGLGPEPVQLIEATVIWPGRKEQKLEIKALKVRRYNNVLEAP